MRNHSYENDFDLHENGTVCRTRFHMKGFALRLVLKERHKRTRKWPIVNQSVSRFFGTDLFTDLASPQQGQITSCMPVRSHVNRFVASVENCSLALTINFGDVIFGDR